jgi:hypothetical protein
VLIGLDRGELDNHMERKVENQEHLEETLGSNKPEKTTVIIPWIKMFRSSPGTSISEVKRLY